MYCFLDMDGVLADFVDGVCQAHDRAFPYDDPSNYGHFDIEPLWGMSSQILSGNPYSTMKVSGLVLAKPTRQISWLR